MRRPHVVYVITRAHRGGAQSHVLDLLALRSRARLTVVAGEEDVLLAEARARGVDTRVVPELQVPLHPARDLRALLALTRLLRELRPDLVHLHSSKAGLLGRVAARGVGVPAVFTAHGWAFTEGVSRSRQRLALLAERLVAPWTDRVITVSAYDLALALARRLLPPERVVPIHNGISPLGPRGSGEDHGPGAPLRAIMVARFSDQKDQPLLIRAAAQVPHLELWLVGDGERRAEAEALARGLGLAGRVQFLGDRDDVPELLAGADLFCLSTHYEGLPISILEAMRAGLPVLSTRVGGVAEAVLDGETGRLLAPGYLAGWVAALRALAADPRERRRLGEAWRTRFLAGFTAGRMLSATWQVYEAVWRERGRRPE